MVGDSIFLYIKTRRLGEIISLPNLFMNKEYKCTYTQCKLGNKVDKSMAVKKGTKYYHPECLKEAENKNMIRKLFLDNINETEVVAMLNRTINQIIDTKNISSDFLLYALNYVINNKLPLNHAGGLHYIINNQKIKESYEKEKSQKIINNIIFNNIDFVSDLNTENVNQIKIKQPKFIKMI
jgi:hypothetical protein